MFRNNDPKLILEKGLALEFIHLLYAIALAEDEGKKSFFTQSALDFLEQNLTHIIAASKPYINLTKKEILETRITLKDEKSEVTKSAMDIVAKHGFVEIVKVLDKVGVDITPPDFKKIDISNWSNPVLIYIAICKQKYELLSDLELSQEELNTALQLAIKENLYKTAPHVIQDLKKRGAQIDSSILEKRLIEILKQKKPTEESEKEKQGILASSLQATYRDADNRSALFWAVWRGDVTTGEQLLKIEEFRKIINQSGEFTDHKTLSQEKMLTLKKCDEGRQSNDLVFVAIFGQYNVNMVSVLLDAGADMHKNVVSDVQDLHIALLWARSDASYGHVRAGGGGIHHSALVPVDPRVAKLEAIRKVLQAKQDELIKLGQFVKEAVQRREHEEKENELELSLPPRYLDENIQAILQNTENLEDKGFEQLRALVIDSDELGPVKQDYAIITKALICVFSYEHQQNENSEQPSYSYKNTEKFIKNLKANKMYQAFLNADKDGFLPVHHFIQKQRVELVKSLLEVAPYSQLHFSSPINSQSLVENQERIRILNHEDKQISAVITAKSTVADLIDYDMYIKEEKAKEQKDSNFNKYEKGYNAIWAKLSTGNSVEAIMKKLKELKGGDAGFMKGYKVKRRHEYLVGGILTALDDGKKKLTKAEKATAQTRLNKMYADVSQHAQQFASSALRR